MSSHERGLLERMDCTVVIKTSSLLELTPLTTIVRRGGQLTESNNIHIGTLVDAKVLGGLAG